jgi:hypothetical protein
MRTVQLTAFIVFISVFTPAQSNRSETNDESLYSLALKTSILQMEKDYERIDDAVGGERMRTDYRHMIVERDDLITKGLPTEFEDHFVEYLDNQELIQRSNKLGKPYATLVIRPVKNEGKILKIDVVVYWVSYKKHRLQLALSDWSNVEFQYDCERQKFIVSSVKLDGI